MAAARGLRGGTAVPTQRNANHAVRGTAWRGLVPISIAEMYASYGCLMHPEAPVKNKNVLKPVKNLVHKYYF